MELECIHNYIQQLLNILTQKISSSTHVLHVKFMIKTLFAFITPPSKSNSLGAVNEVIL